ncbi:MAG: RluA family pseudouridine synthase [Ruminococcaceae bacterium]|nr:RluA family pseudouridine synthase [Oscillospiraceae bacterium]
MTIVITEENQGKTIRDFLKKGLGFSSGLLKKLKARENGITVNGSFVTVRYVLKAGDTLCLADEDRAEDTSPYIIPVDIPLKVAFEDSDVTVADKPRAMPAHPSFSHRDDTVANALAFRYSGSPYVFRPVNRLDGDTSGLMITANNHLAAHKLGRAMISGRIGKMYIAVLRSAPPEEYGVIDLHMKRCADSIITRRVADPSEEGARRAVTVYKRVYTDKDSGECVVIASPVTGRTHQLRVHFSAIGCPLIGDYLYGGDDERITRHALHAAYCSFPHPRDGETVHVYSSLPDDIRALIGEDISRLAEENLKEESEGYLRTLYDNMKKEIAD